MTVRGGPLSRSLFGPKRTSLIAAHMSANDPKRTSDYCKETAARRYSLMKLNPEQYKLIAEEWEKRAAKAPSHVRAEFLNLAVQWWEFAADAEAIESARHHKQAARRLVRAR
jgi:hypothetical protein